MKSYLIECARQAVEAHQEENVIRYHITHNPDCEGYDKAVLVTLPVMAYVRIH